MTNSGYIFHPPGELSRTGVLDVGLKCAHSCRFCYYSFMAEAEGARKADAAQADAIQACGQHSALRHASFRSTEDCLAIVDRMADHGLINFDITGGEPAMHPGLPDMVRRARQRGLGVRVITLGQFLMQRGGGRERLLDALLDAGVTDFLFSLHSATEQGFHEATRGSLAKVLAAMDALDAVGFQYAANTVIHAGNVAELPAIAALSAARGVYHHNFIVFNAYYRWDSPESIAGLQAAYTDIAGPLTRAVEILDAAGVAVTIRYLPLCAAPHLARHIVGVVGVHHDPHEWMNRAGNPEREPDYCAEPLPVPVNAPRDIYALKRGKGRVRFGKDGAPEAIVDAVAVRGENFKVFPAPCKGCAAMDQCDGLDPKYILLHGLSGVAPFDRAEAKGPLLQARRDYLPAFALKLAPGADMRAAVARVMGRGAPLGGEVLLTAVVDAGAGAEKTLAALQAQISTAPAGLRLEVLCCEPGLARAEGRNRAAELARGAVLAFFPAGSLPRPDVLARSVDILARRPEVSLVDMYGRGADFQTLLARGRANPVLAVRREAFHAAGGFQPGLDECLCWDFQLAAAAAGHFGPSVADVCCEPPGTAPGDVVDAGHPEFPQVVRRTPMIFPRETALAHARANAGAHVGAKEQQ